MTRINAKQFIQSEIARLVAGKAQTFLIELEKAINFDAELSSTQQSFLAEVLKECTYTLKGISTLNVLSVATYINSCR